MHLVTRREFRSTVELTKAIFLYYNSLKVILSKYTTGLYCESSSSDTRSASFFKKCDDEKYFFITNLMQICYCD